MLHAGFQYSQCLSLHYFNRIEMVGQRPYIYIKDLLQLEAEVPSTELVLLDVLNSVVTPLHTPAWKAALSELTSGQRFRTLYVCTELSRGFRIGFDRSQPTKSVRANIPSASLHPEVIAAFLDKERFLRRIMVRSTTAGYRLNRCGVVPKGHIPGKWRVITQRGYRPSIMLTCVLVDRDGGPYRVTPWHRRNDGENRCSARMRNLIGRLRNGPPVT